MKRQIRMTVSKGEKARDVETMSRHLADFAGWFNEALASSGLAIRLDPEQMVESVRTMSGVRVREMVAAYRDHGIHREQVQTAAEVIANMIREPGRSGVIIGALQSGKTGSAFATLFAAPMVYLQTGLRFVPLFLTTNQVSHLDQTKRAMRSFFNLYGDIDIRREGEFDADAAGTLLDFYAEAGYDFEVAEPPEDNVTLRGYSHGMLRDAETDDEVVSAIVDAMTFKRVQGRELTDRIGGHCRRAREDGSAVLLIVDEPQYGASDTYDRDTDELKPCLLSRVFREVDPDFFGSDTPNMMVGLSATPFDTHGMSNLFSVRQRLAAGYVGPNCFDGRPIDPRVEAKPVNVVSFSDLDGSESGLFEGFEEVNYLLGHRRSPVDKDYVARKIDERGAMRPMSPLERVARGTELVRDLLDSTLLSRAASRRVGALVRFSQSRNETDALIRNLGLEEPGSPYNVIRFYGKTEDAARVDTVIRRATAGDDRPYLFVVVGKGRMGDAFPASCEVGVDLTQKPADMNALLQGVYGRMCGYGKGAALTVMSDESADAIREYVRSQGRTDVLKSSRHSLVARNSAGRKQTMRFVRFTDDAIDAEPEDSPLREARARFEAYLATYLDKPTDKRNVPKRQGSQKFFPIADLLEDTGLADYVAGNMHRLDPGVVGVPRILPVGVEVPMGEAREDGTVRTMSYRDDPDGTGRQEVLVTKVSEEFRKARASNNRAPDILGRRLSQAVTQGFADAKPKPKEVANAGAGSKAPRGNYDGSAMPVIEVIKVHPDDPSRVVEFDEPGRYVFAAMTFHLENEVRREAVVKMGHLPAAAHSAIRASNDRERAEVLNVLMGRALGKRRFDRDDRASEAIMSRDAQGIIALMHDPRTHTWTYGDGVLSFSEVATGELDNPHGPAVVEFGKPLEVVVSYFDQGERVPERDRSRAAGRGMDSHAPDDGGDPEPLAAPAP